MQDILDLPSTSRENLQYAGFWIRVAAFAIDYVVISVASYACSMVVLVGGMFAAGNETVLSMGIVLAGILVLVQMAYFILMEASGKQGTLGKMAVGIKVGDDNGDRISIGVSLARFFSKFLSTIAFCVGFMMAGWDAKKQGLHDKIAGTYVYYSRFSL